MTPMAERLKQAGEDAIPLLVDIHLNASAQACQALEALDPDSADGFDLEEANRRIDTMVRLLVGTTDPVRMRRLPVELRQPSETTEAPHRFPRSMSGRIRQAGDAALPMMVDIHILASAEAFQALYALEKPTRTGRPNVQEATYRLRRLLRLLLNGER